ncbi:hypothetical protein [Methylobacterium sp. Leaf94]|uniref:hypothetical protein n=1 Tax=Methylobacterium sp. Leaf94 TaxID=1736250 RepID=UPI000ABBC99F|nr:hypothetical protein [Methylobacterium sp. Leaf94]
MGLKPPRRTDTGGASPYNDDVEPVAHGLKVRSADMSSKVLAAVAQNRSLI